MKEQKYQSKIIKNLEDKGYYCLNLIKTSKNGVADILALKKGEEPVFIEVKTLNGVLSPLQKYRLTEQKEFGFKTYYSKGFDIIEWE